MKVYYAEKARMVEKACTKLLESTFSYEKANFFRERSPWYDFAEAPAEDTKTCRSTFEKKGDALLNTFIFPLT